LPARFDLAVQEAFYWGEIFDNGGSVRDYGQEMTPGIAAALSGLWRGRNKAENEEVENKNNRHVTTDKEREERRRRYSAPD